MAALLLLLAIRALLEGPELDRKIDEMLSLKEPKEAKK